MTTRVPARGRNDLQISVRRVGRRFLVLELSGLLNYYTAELLTAAYDDLVEAEGASLHRLVLDLRSVHGFDGTGAAALLHVVRDAETRPFGFLVADRPERPTYIATGLRERLKFLTPDQIERMGL